jgi:predicted  nucleic acid-binding Zn-ribbon protein
LETRLRLLFALQKVDLGLNELEEMRGDLPFTVKKLEESLHSKLMSKQELEGLKKQSLVSRDATDVEILTLKERIEKYKTQQFQVKTNKQYDVLTREIELSQDRVTKLQREMELLEGKASLAKTDIESLQPEIAELEQELAERRKELAAVNKEHEEEESKLVHERDKFVARITKADYQMYERIRKAKDGKAVVAVKRNSCGGCFNRVPPQKILELRKNDTILTCERCGRIIVSDGIVELTDQAE